MTLTRRAALTTLAGAPLALGLASRAMAMTPPWNTTSGVAIQGTDPVAYFTEEKPVEGSAEFAAEYDGATFHFASAANRDAFLADPAAYAPQYGGYCAYAVSRGYTASIDPRAWSIHEGKLYLNYSRSVRALWAAQKRKNIEAGDANWPGVLG